MSFLLRNLVRLAVREVANDPETRAKAARAARALAQEARRIAGEEDRARAAGRAVRRALDKVREPTRHGGR